MSLRNTWFWVLLAGGMFVGLMAYERLFHRAPAGPELLLPGFAPEAVQSLQVLSARNSEKILAERTNGNWVLTQPISYPAQASSIEALLKALQQVRPSSRISPSELRGMKGEGDAFGLENPQYSLVFSGEEARRQLLVGSSTAPGDQVFVQLVGGEGVSVVAKDLLQLIPATVASWRDKRLFRLTAKGYDGITVNSKSQALELRLEPTNKTWQIVKPTPARADGERLGTMVQALRNLQVRRFVTDNPRGDREAFGLQPPELELQFRQGTNTAATLRFGRSVNDETDLVYAVGLDADTVVAVPSDSLSEWAAPPNAFRDRQLIELTRPVAMITFQNDDTFTLRRATNVSWRVEPAGYSGDTNTIERFIRRVDELRVLQFVKDVVAEPDLPSYGLAKPRLRMSFTFEPAVADQPGKTVQLEFGDVVDGKTYVRRADENAVYAVDEAALAVLPAAAGHFRDRHIWHFSEENVTAMTVRKGDKSWRVIRNGQQQWTLAPGSQGILNAGAMEEIAHRLGGLSAVVWTAWKEGEAATYGVNESSVSLTMELKDGTQLSVRFGNVAPSTNVYAATMLDGKEWVFEFPPDIFDLVQAFLITPAQIL